MLSARFRHGAWHRTWLVMPGGVSSPCRGGAGSRAASLRASGRRPGRRESPGCRRRACDVGDRFKVGARAEPEDGGAARADERQAPLDGRRRLRERLRERDAVHVDSLLLGAAPDDARVRRRPPLEEVALAPLRLEQRHLALRQRRGERDPRRAAARADVDDRPVERRARPRPRAARRPRASPAPPPRRAERSARASREPRAASHAGRTTT